MRPSSKTKWASYFASKSFAISSNSFSLKLATYKTFESVADMDTAVEEHIAAHYYDLTESERSIVFKLASHILEHPGASHLKDATIAAAFEIRTNTVYRAISKLESLGIVKKETTVKSKGGQGAASTLFALQCPSVEMLKSLVRVRLKRNNLKTNHLNLLSSKQANNIMSLGKWISFASWKEKGIHERVPSNATHFMHSMPIQDELKDQLHKCILATKMNDIRDFVNGVINYQ